MTSYREHLLLTPGEWHPSSAGYYRAAIASLLLSQLLTVTRQRFMETDEGARMSMRSSYSRSH